MKPKNLIELLDEMPSRICVEGHEYDLQIHKFYNPEIEMDSYEIGYFDRDFCSPRGGWADNIDLLSATDELYKYLLKGHIKKGGKR